MISILIKNTKLEKYFCKILYIYAKKQNIVLIFTSNNQKNLNCQKRKLYWELTPEPQ